MALLNSMSTIIIHSPVLTKMQMRVFTDTLSETPTTCENHFRTRLEAPISTEVLNELRTELMLDINQLPEKYDTEVGERGVGLSGGQKQRVAIARALLVDPRILILDDSTSSVDVETEYKIQQALERIMKGTTTFIITQRISTIREANLILILDQGRVVGLGTHEDLINSNVLYKQIYETLYQKQNIKDEMDT